MVVLAQSPAGPIEPIANLKQRQTHRYWRLIGGQWIQTHPLPADPVSQSIYLAKGFRMDYPDKGEPAKITDPEKETLYAEIAQLRKEREEMKEKKAVKAAI